MTTTETPSVDEARSAVWAAYYEVQAAVQSPRAPAPDMLRAIAAFEAALIRERDEAIGLLRDNEWEGEAWGEPACPECNGLMPPPHAADPAYDARTINRFGVGHRADCALARLLSRLPEGGEG